MKKYLVNSLCFFISCGVFAQSSVKSDVKKRDKKPNIVILLADDMGYGELGSYGQKEIKTPFLDSLATQGLRFTNFYAGSSVCSPSRASLLTGMHTGHVSIRGNKGFFEKKIARVPLSKKEITLPEMLKGAGYQSAMIGKWHLGVPEDESTWAKGRGFDYAVQEQWGVDQNGEDIDERVHWVNNNEEAVLYDYTKYSCLDEFRTNFAIHFLQHKKNKEQPFFLYMSYRIPHAHEFHIKQNTLYAEKGWPESERNHAARITMFDRQVKRLFNALKAQGELENTIILFTSDNGPQKENHDPLFFNSSGGLRGYKRDLYEGGIREPMFVYWKNHIKAGTTTDHPSTFYDIMPTLAEIATIKTPKQTDGISFLPILLNKEQPKHDHLYWEIQLLKFGKSPKGFIQAARKGKWKAIRTGNSLKTELYDLSNDIYEKNDISEKHPEVTKELNRILKSESRPNKYYPNAGGVF